jgi:hypothetical protein
MAMSSEMEADHSVFLESWNQSMVTSEMINGQIALTPSFRHRNLKERAAAFDGDLKQSDEMERDEPVGTEVW